MLDNPDALWWKGPSLLNSLQYSFDSYCVCCEGKDACSFDCEISSWKPGDETDVEEKRFVVTMKAQQNLSVVFMQLLMLKGLAVLRECWE